MATKMGQKRTEPRQALRHSKPERMILYSSTISPVSRKHAADLREYNKIRNRLMELSGGKSEISGQSSKRTIEDTLSPHHITGRIGRRLLNPFNIVICLEREHWIWQDAMSWENKLTLLALVEPIRLSQGFKKEDYEALI